MNGNYAYAAIKFTLSKVIDRENVKHQKFIDGDYEIASTVSKPYFNGLPAG